MIRPGGDQQQAVDDSYLTFMMHHQHFAVHVSKVTELMEMLPVTRVPRAPEYMRGVLNLRGSAVPVIDMRVKLSLPTADDTMDTCIIVLHVKADQELLKIGAIVDSVFEVIEVTPEAILPPATVGNKELTRFIDGVIKLDNKFIVILDMDKIFSHAEYTDIRRDDPIDSRRG
ncbi:chemotaxis protein CheW [Dawidia soli]|uniref:Chemotaxis protein CheW n=1 Tax=Dawidia soli TaxID=2782352 RepID=A0AAP2D4I0_9BACT|nr:chemotaxis protein CheW [Dawidia soli]MBT1685158.1 chemotaxis protein CheW [Dawidia soli]